MTSMNVKSAIPILIGTFGIAYTLGYKSHKFRVDKFITCEDTPSAFVAFVKGGTPLLVDVRVQDANGVAISNAAVGIGNSSGGNSKKTDMNGHAEIRMAERDMTDIWMDGKQLIKGDRLRVLGIDTVEAGIGVVIVRKGLSEK